MRVCREEARLLLRIWWRRDIRGMGAAQHSEHLSPMFFCSSFGRSEVTSVDLSGTIPNLGGLSQLTAM